MTMADILIVDDKASLSTMLREALEAQGHQARTAAGGGEALLALKKRPADLVLTDLKMPGLDGLELTREVKARWPETAVVVMTAFGGVEDAVEAMRLGAANFLAKPFSLDALKVIVDKALTLGALAGENKALRARLAEGYRFDGVLGAGPKARRLHQLVAKVAAGDGAVLITGESGTGKELVARAIHMNSARAAGPFVAVNCAALAPGLVESELFGHERGAFTGAVGRRQGRFELAHGGTLLLDEVGDLPLDVQVKLLRVLQERCVERVGSSALLPVDVRLAAATHCDLAGLVKQGRFREDLYFRLAVLPIHLPPLRQRQEDLQGLASHLLARLRPGPQPPRLSPEALKRLKAHAWPGNIRELENVLQRALLLCGADGLIKPSHLPPELDARPSRGASGFNQQVEALERRLLAQALRQAKGSQSAAAAALGLSRPLLIYKLKKFQLSPADYKPPKGRKA
jgi:DNA-binding NtrC family response regulator